MGQILVFEKLFFLGRYHVRSRVLGVEMSATPQIRIRKWNPQNIKDDRIVMIVGRRGTGKSVLQRDIMRHLSDRVDWGIAMTPTEDTVSVYSEHMPESCIYREFNRHMNV